MTTGKRLGALLIALGVGIALPAPSYGQHTGEEVPAFDVDPTCRGGAAEENVNADDKAATFATCLQQEQQARAELKTGWSTFAVADRRDCANETQTDGPPSYVDLLLCLQDRKFERDQQQKASP